jgi:hypothetical protein
MQTNSLSLHDNQETLHDREHATATKRMCVREREKERRGATERRQWRQNKREREKRGHKGNEVAEENYFLLFWMKTE